MVATVVPRNDGRRQEPVYSNDDNRFDMSDQYTHARAQRVLKWFAVLLALFGLVMVLIGQFAVAGVTFLGITLIIYLRETW